MMVGVVRAFPEEENANANSPRVGGYAKLFTFKRIRENDQHTQAGQKHQVQTGHPYSVSLSNKAWQRVFQAHVN